jgi:hypothetical protein
MNQDDTLRLAQLGMQMFTHVSTTSSIRRTNPYLGQDNLATASDLAQVARTLHRIGSAAPPTIVSQWLDQMSYPIGLAYNRETRTVRLSLIEPDVRVTYRYSGAGMIENHAITAMVSGVSKTGELAIIQLVSHDGYAMKLSIMVGGETKHTSVVRLSEWAAGTL